MVEKALKRSIITITDIKEEVMIDIHSHILPGIDDGAKKLSDSLEMIKRSFSEGSTHLVATPHYKKGHFEVTYDEVKKIVKGINKLIDEENLNGKVYAGQEIYFTEELLELYKKGIIGTINNSRYMLIEFSMSKIDKQEALDCMYELNLLGITPIIAHPERYRDVMKDPSFLNDFIDEGCLFQLNVGSLRGDFGKEVKKTAEKLSKHRIYSFVGSDAHNNINRVTGIKDGIEELSSIYKKYWKILQKNSIDLIENNEIKFEGETLKNKKKFFIF